MKIKIYDDYDVQKIKQSVKSTLRCLKDSIRRKEAEGCPEFIAYELIDLVEWTSEPRFNKSVAKYIVNKTNVLDSTSRGIVRKYFEIY